MHKIFLNFTIFLFIIIITGCVTARYPRRVTPEASLFTRCNGPIVATQNIKYNKCGITSAKGVLGLVAWGDASITTAASLAGITKMHHVDYDYMKINAPYFNFLIYEEFKTKVYGE